MRKSEMAYRLTCENRASQAKQGLLQREAPDKTPDKTSSPQPCRQSGVQKCLCRAYASF